MKSIPRLEFVACHRKPERSFFYKGKQFPVCARCTGMLLGYILFPFFLFNLMSLGLLNAFLLNMPAYIDGVTQGLGWRYSTNPLRFFTGLLSGVGQVGLVTIIGQWLGDIAITLLGI